MTPTVEPAQAHLFAAIDAGDAAGITEAMREGASATKLHPLFGDVPLLRAVMARNWKRNPENKGKDDYPIAAIIALLNAGADVNYVETDRDMQHSLLHYVSNYCPQPMLRLMLACGANENQPDEYGALPGYHSMPNGDAFFEKVGHADYKKNRAFLDALRAGTVERPKPEEFAELGLDMGAHERALTQQPATTVAGAQHAPLLGGISAAIC